jgi:hypothetical protein
MFSSIVLPDPQARTKYRVARTFFLRGGGEGATDLFLLLIESLNKNKQKEKKKGSKGDYKAMIA